MKAMKRTKEQCVSVSLTELLQLSKSAQKFPHSRLRVGSLQSGQQMSRLLGKGMEFAESRRYQPGDDIRSIDWRVTARTGKPHTKLFTVEKERRVLLAVDLRSPMFFATRGVFKSVQASLMMGHMAWSAVQSGDRLGGIIIDDGSFFESKPALGKRGALPFLHELSKRSDFRKNIPSSASSVTTMDNAIASLGQMASPGSLVFLVSDFRHFSDYAHNLLVQIAKRCDLCLCFVYDPLEAMLPANGCYPVSDGQNELRLNTYDRDALERYKKQFIDRKNRIESLGNQRHVYYIECSTEDDFLELWRNQKYREQ